MEQMTAIQAIEILKTNIERGEHYLYVLQSAPKSGLMSLEYIAELIEETKSSISALHFAVCAIKNRIDTEEGEL